LVYFIALFESNRVLVVIAFDMLFVRRIHDSILFANVKH
jgi:hypothetical protein